MRKLLFPPVVPNSLPAFDKGGSLRYFFKPAITNSISQIKHIQVSLVRLDTNKTILNTNTYPFGLMFINASSIQKDSNRGYWYFDIPARLFPTSDVPYKVQIRFGERSVSGLSTPSIGEVLKDLDSMSEWSIVTMVMPITVPDFGIQSFSESGKNTVMSTGFVFNGFYQPNDNNKQETLTSYKYDLYEGNSEGSLMTFIGTSGERFVEKDRANMDFIFPMELKEKHNYTLAMTIKTKNLYTKQKRFKLYCGAHPVFEMFNSLDVIPLEDRAAMKVDVKVQQTLLHATEGTCLEYYKDELAERGYVDEEDLPSHVRIKGTIVDEGDFLVTPKEGKWVCQFKALFPEIGESLKQVIEKPTIEISQTNSMNTNSGYYTKIKVGAIKINLAYPTSKDLNPKPEWEYRFIVRKEILSKVNGEEVLLFNQNKIFRQDEINPKQEYYFFIKEEDGNMIVDIQKTHLSANFRIYKEEK